MSERKKRRESRQFSDEEKAQIVEEFAASGLTAKKFAPIYNIAPETLSKWKQRHLHPERKFKRTIKRGGPYSLQDRLRAIEAYIKSGLSQSDFSKTWGVSEVTLSRWNSLYKKFGPKGLEGSVFQDKFRKYKERHQKRSP
jgi:transposase-like protein